MSTAACELKVAGLDAPVLVRLRPSSRARTMRLRFDVSGAGFSLSFPTRVGKRRALLWAGSQGEWIRATLSAAPPALRLAPGTVIPLRGLPHRLADGPGRGVVAGEGVITVGGPAELFQRRVLRWLRSEALNALSERTLHYAARAGVSVGRVSVGDPVSRWGSCSSTGSIRYSWRLILAPDHVLDATAAHEVAHRVHMDHSPAFHALVERISDSDPSAARLWLRRNGAALHRIGIDGGTERS